MRLARTPGEVEIIRRLVDEQRSAGLDLDFLPTAAAVRDRGPALPAAGLTLHG